MEGSAKAIPDILEEYTRLIDEKARQKANKQTPSTKVNYDLTRMVHEIVDLARAEHSEEVRALLTREAAQEHNGAEIALEWLSEEDPWWSGRGE